MKILVLGANGQVGSELFTQLEDVLPSEERCCKIILADRSHVDVSDLHALRAFLDHHAPYWIINATGYTAVEKAEMEAAEAHIINEHAVRALAKYCAKNNSCLIHISTDYVFDGRGEHPFCEESKVAPLGVYGASKFAGEAAIRSTLERYIILRTSWVFGVSGGNFVKTMLRLAEEGGELRVVGDQYGAPTSARSIAKAIATIILYMNVAEGADKRWGTYHFSGKPYVSWAQFAREIFEQAASIGLIDTKPQVNPIQSSEYPATAKRPANSRLDCSKLRRVFDIEPDDWKQALTTTLHELKDNLQE